jgi:hypothetical protein
VAITPDGTTAYVVTTNNTLIPIDTANNTIQAPISVGRFGPGHQPSQSTDSGNETSCPSPSVRSGGCPIRRNRAMTNLRDWGSDELQRTR